MFVRHCLFKHVDIRIKLKAPLWQNTASQSSLVVDILCCFDITSSLGMLGYNDIKTFQIGHFHFKTVELHSFQRERTLAMQR